MNYGITEQGFIRKPYKIIEEEIQKRAQELFGSDIDLSDESPSGALFKLMAWSIDRQWQLAEDEYYAHWLDSSEGVSLERVTKFGHISRKPEQYALTMLQFTGEPETAIPAGTIAETESNIEFSTLIEVETDQDGIALVEAKCLTSGTVGNLPVDSINSIKTPISGINDVTNIERGSGGRGKETDFELRKRYEDLPLSTGSAVPAILAAITEISNVVSCVIYENDTNIESPAGLPAHSFEAVVVGGIDAEIANVIFNKKSAGISSYGNHTEVVIDSQGQEHIIKFSRAIDVLVYVIIRLTTNAAWEEERKAEIIQNTIEYIGGVDADQVEHNGVDTGSPIYTWKIEAAQMEIPGIETIEASIGKTEQEELDKLEFQVREKAICIPDNITVEIGGQN